MSAVPQNIVLLTWLTNEWQPRPNAKRAKCIKTVRTLHCFFGTQGLQARAPDSAACAVMGFVSAYPIDYVYVT